MTTHGAHPNTQAIDGHRARGSKGWVAQNLVGLGTALPLLLGLSVIHRHIDPWNEASRQGHTPEIGDRQARAAQGLRDLAIDLQNGTLGVCKLLGHAVAQGTHLLEQLTHVLCARARGRLVAHDRHPVHEPGAKQPAHGHEHEAHRAVATDPGACTLVECCIDDRTIHRIEDEHRVVLHAQGRGRIDPVARPAHGTQPGVDVVGVVAALTADDDLLCRKRLQVVGRCKHTRAAAHHGGLATCIGGGKEGGLHVIEIALLLHALHEHGAHHAPPPHQSKSLHAQFSNAATTAAPISRVPTIRQPALAMSPVARPSASTLRTAVSMAVASSSRPKL